MARLAGAASAWKTSLTHGSIGKYRLAYAPRRFRQPQASASGACGRLRAVMRRMAELVGRRRGRVVRAASALVAVGAAVLAVAVPSGAATRECFLLRQCTPVVGPWVVIPATGPTTVPAGVTVSCPDGNPLPLAVGSDYELSGGGLPPADVTRYMTGPGIGLITGRNAFFFAVHLSSTPASFRAHVGCISQPGGQAALQTATDDTVRMREVRLHPSRT